VRDPYSWCESWLDHNLNSPPEPSSLFARLDRVRLRVDDFPPTPHDAPLVARGFPSLACFFQLWATHNGGVVRAVPPERLLIVKTQEIGDRITDVARWVGVAEPTLRRDRAWLFAAPRKHHLLSSLDRGYVADTATRFCGALMKELATDEHG
jgi:hypothetical protein